MVVVIAMRTIKMTLEGCFNQFVGGFCFGGGMIVVATLAKAFGMGFC